MNFGKPGVSQKTYLGPTILYLGKQNIFGFLLEERLWIWE
jgi:hypothetical protein